MIIRQPRVVFINLLAIDDTKSGNHPWSKDFSQRSRQFSNSIKKRITQFVVMKRIFQNQWESKHHQQEDFYLNT